MSLHGIAYSPHLSRTPWKVVSWKNESVRKTKERAKKSKGGQNKRKMERKRWRLGWELWHAPHRGSLTVSYRSLYFRCAFGYSGLNCEDSEYESLAIINKLLNIWEISSDPIQHPAQSFKVSVLFHKERDRLPPVCLLGPAMPCPPLGYEQQPLCRRK